MSAATPRGVRFELARVTLELTSPLKIGVGGPALGHEPWVTTDANPLPCIPGTTLAGVLRQAFSDDETRRSAVFGYQTGDRGASSEVEVSAGQLHGADDLPVPFRGHSAANDEVLAFVRTGVLRDHVRLDGFGAADGDGKFSVASVPRGARFTFELVVHPASEARMRDLLAALCRPSVRLGGGSRRGLGTFRVVRVHQRAFDLTKPADRTVFLALPRSLARPPCGLPRVEPPSAAGSSRSRTFTMQLTPEDTWFIGHGDPDAFASAGRSPDHAPYRERSVVWENGRGRVGPPKIVVPGTAIKGPLRHRTAYHLRRLNGQFYERVGATSGVSPELIEIFGEARDDDHGSAGRFGVDDVWLDSATTGWFDHVRIDRFSGAPMDGCLFSEAPVVGGSLSVRLTVEDHPRWSPIARQALAAALEDLGRGRLAIGAGSSRGHGFVRGSVPPELSGRSG